MEMMMAYPVVVNLTVVPSVGKSYGTVFGVSLLEHQGRQKTLPIPCKKKWHVNQLLVREVFSEKSYAGLWLEGEIQGSCIGPHDACKRGLNGTFQVSFVDKTIVNGPFLLWCLTNILILKFVSSHLQRTVFGVSLLEHQGRQKTLPIPCKKKWHVNQLLVREVFSEKSYAGLWLEGEIQGSCIGPHDACKRGLNGTFQVSFVDKTIVNGPFLLWCLTNILILKFVSSHLQRTVFGVSLLEHQGRQKTLPIPCKKKWHVNQLLVREVFSEKSYAGLWLEGEIQGSCIGPHDACKRGLNGTFQVSFVDKTIVNGPFLLWCLTNILILKFVSSHLQRTVFGVSLLEHQGRQKTLPIPCKKKWHVNQLLVREVFSEKSYAGLWLEGEIQGSCIGPHDACKRGLNGTFQDKTIVNGPFLLWCLTNILILKFVSSHLQRTVFGVSLLEHQGRQKTLPIPCKKKWHVNQLLVREVFSEKSYAGLWLEGEIQGSCIGPHDACKRGLNGTFQVSFVDKTIVNGPFLLWCLTNILILKFVSSHLQRTVFGVSLLEHQGRQKTLPIPCKKKWHVNQLLVREVFSEKSYAGLWLEGEIQGSCIGPHDACKRGLNGTFQVSFVDKTIVLFYICHAPVEWHVNQLLFRAVVSDEAVLGTVFLRNAMRLDDIFVGKFQTWCSVKWCYPIPLISDFSYCDPSRAKTLRGRCKEPRAMVKDPLPDALQLSGQFTTAMARKSSNQVRNEKEKGVSAHDPSANLTKELDAGIELAECHLNSISKLCSMKLNVTSCNFVVCFLF
ncbi:hypothetical protein SADUNF_Sadunf12G0048200 [Salix dunnii]|uniref:Uncharacterized protein n=1 Tax=Salix dunnii TaxID=1413687 RepID=A0A835JJK2_9ROSI|nr:hypothetical protein SADUNF_Sadunf12G0048200 [Salix dunnii]